MKADSLTTTNTKPSTPSKAIQPIPFLSFSIVLSGDSIAKRSLGTYAVGFLYGLHPDALFVVLPALTLPTALATLSYIVMFVIGTVSAMAGYTLAIGTLEFSNAIRHSLVGKASEAATGNRPWLLQHLSTLASCVAIVVGCFVLLPSFGCQLPFSF